MPNELDFGFGPFNSPNWDGLMEIDGPFSILCDSSGAHLSNTANIQDTVITKQDAAPLPSVK